MYSASTACVRDETIRSGCAKVYAAQIQGSISPIATIGLMLISLQVLVCVGSTCMCLKRKDHDVLPPPEAFVDKRVRVCARAARRTRAAALSHCASALLCSLRSTASTLKSPRLRQRPLNLPRRHRVGRVFVCACAQESALLCVLAPIACL